MTTAKRRQTTLAVAVSAAAHLLVGVVLILQKPTLLRPLNEAGGPPEAIIPILIMPRTPQPTASAAQAKPAPLRLHRRPQRFLPPEAQSAPIAPPAPIAMPAAPPGHGLVVLHPAPMPEGPKGDVRAVLRQGTMGCANPLTVGLNRSEREHCDEVFGKGAKDTAFAGLGLSADKQKLFDIAGARKEADYRYKHSQAPGAVPDTDMPGKTAEGMKKSLGVEGHSATIPF